MRFTIDHVALDALSVALTDAGFARGGGFATQLARPTRTAAAVDIRVGTVDDLDAIATLSQIEFSYRATPPIYAHPLRRTLSQARQHHERLLEDGAIHFLAARHDRDVGLITVEFASPAPRLCPNGEPYIGPTATDPAVRGQGIGSALVNATLDWASVNGHPTVSVDFDSPNPLSRPFWLEAGIQPTGYRTRRTIDATYLPRPNTPSQPSG